MFSVFFPCLFMHFMHPLPFSVLFKILRSLLFAFLMVSWCLKLIIIRSAFFGTSYLYVILAAWVAERTSFIFDDYGLSHKVRAKLLYTLPHWMGCEGKNRKDSQLRKITFNTIGCDHHIHGPIIIQHIFLSNGYLLWQSGCLTARRRYRQRTLYNGSWCKVHRVHRKKKSMILMV